MKDSVHRAKPHESASEPAPAKGHAKKHARSKSHKAGHDGHHAPHGHQAHGHKAHGHQALGHKADHGVASPGAAQAEAQNSHPSASEAQAAAPVAQTAQVPQPQGHPAETQAQGQGAKFALNENQARGLKGPSSSLSLPPASQQKQAPDARKAAQAPKGYANPQTEAKPLKGQFMATAYYPAHDRMNGGDVTARGHRVHAVDEARKDGLPATAAVDPHVIPYGTHFTLKQFPGVTFVADDTGGRIKGHHIDIAMSTKEQCMNWGHRSVSGE